MPANISLVSLNWRISRHSWYEENVAEWSVTFLTQSIIGGDFYGKNSTSAEQKSVCCFYTWLAFKMKLLQGGSHELLVISSCSRCYLSHFSWELTCNCETSTKCLSMHASSKLCFVRACTYWFMLCPQAEKSVKLDWRHSTSQNFR